MLLVNILIGLLFYVTQSGSKVEYYIGVKLLPKRTETNWQFSQACSFILKLSSWVDSCDMKAADIY